MPKLFAGSLESPWNSKNLSNLKHLNLSSYNAILFYGLSTINLENVQQYESSFDKFNDILLAPIEDFNDYEDYNLQNFPYDAPSYDNINTVYQFIKEHQNENILVACSAGISRTGAIVDYLLSKNYQENTQGNNLAHMMPNPTIQRILSEFDSSYQPNYLDLYINPQTIDVKLPEIKF